AYEPRAPRPPRFAPGPAPQDPPLSSDSRPRSEVITLSPPRASSEAPPSLSTVPAPPRSARSTPFAFGGLLPVGEEKRLRHLGTPISLAYSFNLACLLYPGAWAARCGSASNH